MLTEERHNFILVQLKQSGLVKSQDLMTALDCSESTIRRDLALLEEAGELIRIHGGAKRVYHLDEELSATEKTFKNVQEKKAIAELAASFIEENDTIYLDAGTTTIYLIPFLKDKNVRVVTNGIQHASLLADQQTETILLGGKIKATTKAIIGTTSLQQMGDYRFNKCFLGMNGIDVEFGYTTPDSEEAAVKKQAHLHSAKTFVLADQTKFNKVNFVKVCELEDATIVTEAMDHALYKKYFSQTSIKEVTK
ncbi:MAG: DeoR/GlpR family DNA-binding transcription regulator [Carnobacterium sp.]|uniref:DeoR/GlpR family DNA-binding transcription regulator n=1 Tax=Carnobacterium antarcticum TaxID=2126436 RepID=A0ABW4NMV7_9LACT|nr:MULTISPECIES: DeoR/GlpR family DNA-binding transcription regulator [unclassified Carnobacterium]ALV21110.1 Transcriptional repressor of the fructose operon, DeoR [Carnobacterium sp. CP1]QQP71253.1 DeoR/GlpR transcriptional regulator [Carnobacterium sp. CS13]